MYVKIKINPHAVGRGSCVHFSWTYFLVNVLQPKTSLTRQDQPQAFSLN